MDLNSSKSLHYESLYNHTLVGRAGVNSVNMKELHNPLGPEEIKDLNGIF